HLCTEACRLLGKRITHAPARVVRDVTNGIDGLAGRAGRYDDVLSGERLAMCEKIDDMSHDRLGLRKPSFSDKATREVAMLRIEDPASIAAQHVQITLGGRVQVH